MFAMVAILVFCVVLLASTFVTNVMVIQPFHLAQLFHLPQIFVWGVLFLFFAWIFGDETSPWL